LYEGRMIGQFDFSEKGWVSGKGRSAVWRNIPFDEKVIEPQYLMGVSNYLESKFAFADTRIAFIGIVSSTNSRSMTCSLVPSRFPTSNVVPGYRLAGIKEALCLAGYFNSYVFDYCFRLRLGGGVMFA